MDDLRIFGAQPHLFLTLDGQTVEVPDAFLIRETADGTKEAVIDTAAVKAVLDAHRAERLAVLQDVFFESTWLSP